MAFRFRKSIKLFPGVRINLSRSGVSASIGRPGATINISDKGTRATVGIPGTGISYSERIAPGRSLMTTPKRTSAASVLGWLLVVCFFAAVFYRLAG